MQLIINAESPEVMTLHPIWTLAMEKRAGFSLWGFKGDRPEVRETDLKTQVVAYPWTRGNCVPSIESIERLRDYEISIDKLPRLQNRISCVNGVCLFLFVSFSARIIALRNTWRIPFLGRWWILKFHADDFLQVFWLLFSLT